MSAATLPDRLPYEACRTPYNLSVAAMHEAKGQRDLAAICRLTPDEMQAALCHIAGYSPEALAAALGHVEAAHSRAAALLAVRPELRKAHEFVSAGDPGVVANPKEEP